MRKRDGKPDYEALFGRIFGVVRAQDWRPARKNLDVSEPDLSEETEDNDDDDDDEAAQLDEDMDSDDDFEKGDTPMSQLMTLAKRHGWRTVCENFVKRGSAADVFSETEVTQLLTAVARKSHPDLSPDVAFAKAYSAPTPDGELMRRTTQAARDAQFLSRTATVSKAEGMPGRATLTPRVTGGRAAQRVDAPKTALAALQELVDAQRAANPALSEGEAWLRVYEHPDNRELALRERAENRPTATAW